MKSFFREEIGAWTGFAFLLPVAAFLRLHRLAVHDVWLDEANAVLIAERGLTEIVQRLAEDASPPLYYWMLHFWMNPFGQAEAALRALSVLLGLLLIASLFFVGHRLFSTRIGLHAALLAALSPIAVFYSRQIRMYTLLPLVALWSVYFLIRYAEDRKGRDLCGYGIFTLAALYSHHYGLFLLPAHAAIAFVSEQRRQVLLPWILCLGFLFLCFLPWLPTFVHQLERVPPQDWFLPFWKSYGLAGSFLATLKSFSPGGSQPPYLPFHGLGSWAFLPVLLSLLLLVSSLALLSGSKRKGENAKTVRENRPSGSPGKAVAGKRRRLLSLWIFLAAPLLSAGLVSLATSPVYIPGRCDQIVFPAFCLLAASGLEHMKKPRALPILILAIWLTLCLVSLKDLYASDGRNGDRRIAAALREHLKPGDAVVFTSLTRASAEYHLRDLRPSLALYSFPLENARHLGDQNRKKYLAQPGMLIRDASWIERDIRSGRNNGRFFVLYVPSPVNEYLKRHMEKSFGREEVRLLGSFRQSVVLVPVELVRIDFGIR